MVRTSRRHLGWGVALALGGTLFALQAAAEQVELTVLVRESAGENQWERAVFDAYMQKHPEVKLNMLVYTGEAITKLTTLFASGNPPMCGTTADTWRVIVTTAGCSTSDL